MVRYFLSIIQVDIPARLPRIIMRDALMIQ